MRVRPNVRESDAVTFAVGAEVLGYEIVRHIPDFIPYYEVRNYLLKKGDEIYFGKRGSLYNYNDTDRIKRELVVHRRLKRGDRYYPKLVQVDKTTFGRYFLVHEYVPIQDMRYYINNIDSIEEVVRVLLSLCDTVKYLRSLGVLHENLQPKNILYDGRTAPVLVNFEGAYVITPDLPEEIGKGEEYDVHVGDTVDGPVFSKRDQRLSEEDEERVAIEGNPEDMNWYKTMNLRIRFAHPYLRLGEEVKEMWIPKSDPIDATPDSIAVYQLGYVLDEMLDVRNMRELYSLNKENEDMKFLRRLVLKMTHSDTKKRYSLDRVVDELVKQFGKPLDVEEYNAEAFVKSLPAISVEDKIKLCNFDK